MKLSMVIPVYFNEENLRPLYQDIKEKIIDVVDYDYEIVMVNDGSKDDSYAVMQELAEVSDDWSAKHLGYGRRRSGPDHGCHPQRDRLHPEIQ